MKDKLFYILNGNNGASYIINCSDWSSLCNSLNFYKAISFKSKLLKSGLKWLLSFNKIISFFKFKTVSDIENFLQQTVKNSNSFYIDTNCSVLISPTRDKVVVNHHNEYFHKFAFGESINSVQNEKAVYALCGSSTKTFVVSEFFDEYVINDKLYSFKLGTLITKKIFSNIYSIDFVAVLLEFFALSPIRLTSIYDYIDNFSKPIELIDNDVLSAKFSYYKNKDNEFHNRMIPLGLVHRDFKPWNIILMNKPLVFDFEESVMNGLPLEDLFNYIIDPIIRYKSSSRVADIVICENNLILYNKYLDELKVDFGYELFLELYLIERVLFWFNKGEKFTSDKYMSLLKYMENNNLYKDEE